MIAHVVALRLAPGHDRSELERILSGLRDLVQVIDGFVAFQHGPNLDLEGLSPGIEHGFICTFTDRAALARYATAPRHTALGERLQALCLPLPAGIMVLDLETDRT